MLVCPFHADERFLLLREIDVEEMCSSGKEQFIKVMKNKSEKMYGIWEDSFTNVLIKGSVAC